MLSFRRKYGRFALLGVGSLFFCSVQGWSEEPSADAVLSAQEASQASAISTQRRIDALDDETLRMFSTYRSELARLDDLNTYNTNLNQLIASQRREEGRLGEELEEIEVIRREVVPMMVEMIGVLDDFVSLDLPFLETERKARVDALKALITRSDVDIAEKYRRLLEAFQIEAEYGQSIEAYEGAIELNGEALTVDFLRIGRTGLFYLTLDRSACGIWDPSEKAWRDLAERHLDGIDYGVRVARKQAPPDLLEVVLWTAGERG